MMTFTFTNYPSAPMTFADMCKDYLAIYKNATRGLCDFPEVRSAYGLDTIIFIVTNFDKLDTRAICDNFDFWRRRYAIIDNTLCVQLYDDDGDREYVLSFIKLNKR